MGADAAQTIDADRCEGLQVNAIDALRDYPPDIRITEARSMSRADRAICQITGTIDETVGFQMRFPSDGWNGKFLMQGCRAYCGVFMTDDANDALARGYAVATTDMGHQGNILDASWAYNDRQAEENFAYRATLLTTQVATLLVEAYYGDPARRRYFRGCSTGGRQGLLDAQRFPQNYDGIIAGAPVVMGRGTLTLLSMGKANMTADGSAILDKSALTLLHDSVLAACDALDEEQDGILADPRACTHDPAALQCTNENGEDCLTEIEVEAARTVYRGARTTDGRQLAYGPLLGSELAWEAGLTAVEGASPLYFQIAESGLRYFAFREDPGPNYSALAFDLDRDASKLDYIGDLANGFDPDLNTYKQRGGKILLYHGWQDESVPPLTTIDYYESVIDEMGADATDEVLKLYMIPGMNHCGGGPGAGEIDWLSTLEAWVEDGRVPNSVVGRAGGTVVEHRPFGIVD